MSHHIEISRLPSGTFNVFAGAPGGGRSLQITVGSGGYIQLTEDQAAELALKMIIEWPPTPGTILGRRIRGIADGEGGR